MDSEKIHSAWEEICGQVKSYNNIDPTQVNAFFSRLSPQAMSDGFLMLSTDNNFIKTWIERHYIEFIKQALLDLYSIPYTVVIEIDVTNMSDSTNQNVTMSNNPTQNMHNQSTPPSPQSSLNTPTRGSAETVGTVEALGIAEIVTNGERKSDYSNLSSPIAENDKPAFALTFENFVIGDSNRMAYSMAVAVAEMPGKAHLNPLFIYGKSGLGKTHLLRSIQNYIYEALPHISTMYVDSAELLSDYMEASAAHDKEKSSYKNFKKRYEDVDVLLIDDVQYLQGKKQTLDIVFQIFNKLTEQGKQVVLSADRAPKNIDIDERYKSRFNSGGTFDIQPPEIETKLGIIKSFIEEYKEREDKDYLNITEDVQLYIAESSSSNIRELKSAITKVIYRISFSNQTTIELDEVRILLDNHFSGGSSKRLTIADIQKEVELFYKINHVDLVGKKRTKNINNARQRGIYLCRQLLDLPFNDIGKQFNRDHSTVMYSVNNVEEQLKESRELREEIETLKQLIRDI